MKNIKTILAVILLVVLAGCGGEKQSNDNLIIVDVSKSYPLNPQSYYFQRIQTLEDE